MKNNNAISKIKLPDLPTLGIFAFALASTWSLYQFFNNHAIHPTWLYWIPAVLVEIVNAWLTQQAVGALYIVTRSNAQKQDKRFYGIVALISGVLCIPTFVASVQANLFEFGGEFWLALLFPVAVIGCAIGAQIPRSVERYKSERDADKARRDAAKAASAAAKAAKVAPVVEIAAARPLGVADFRAWAAGLNGGGADVTLTDAVDAMVERGLDADSKSQRDKVGRWFRTWRNGSGVEILEQQQKREM